MCGAMQLYPYQWGLVALHFQENRYFFVVRHRVDDDCCRDAMRRILLKRLFYVVLKIS